MRNHDELYSQVGAAAGKGLPLRRVLEGPASQVSVSQALVETSTRVRKGYDRNFLHHDLEVLMLSHPVPPPQAKYFASGGFRAAAVAAALQASLQPPLHVRRNLLNPRLKPTLNTKEPYLKLN